MKVNKIKKRRSSFNELTQTGSWRPAGSSRIKQQHETPRLAAMDVVTTQNPSTSLQESSHVSSCPTEQLRRVQASNSPTHSKCNTYSSLQKASNWTKREGKQKADSGHDHFALLPSGTGISKCPTQALKSADNDLCTSLIPQGE